MKVTQKNACINIYTVVYRILRSSRILWNPAMDSQLAISGTEENIE